MDYTRINALSPAQREMVLFLENRSFDIFCTLTTRSPLTIQGARRIAGKYARLINAGEVCDFFWAAEPFDTRVGYHLHGLITGEWHPSTLKDRWRWGIYDFRYIDKSKNYDATMYVTKYTTKKAADWDFFFQKTIYDRNSQ